MSKRVLFLGISPQPSPPSSMRSIAQGGADGGCEGVMIWALKAFLDTAWVSMYCIEIVEA